MTFPLRLAILFVIINGFGVLPLLAKPKARSILYRMNQKFYWIQDHARMIRFEIDYSGAKRFILSHFNPKLGERLEPIYVEWKRSQGRTITYQSQLAKRLFDPVKLILREIEDLYIPKTLLESVKGYDLTYQRIKDGYHIVALHPPQKKPLPHFVRIDFFCDLNFLPRHIDYLTKKKDKIYQDWELLSFRGKYLPLRIHRKLLIKDQPVERTIIYIYKKIDKFIFPEKIRIRTRIPNQSESFEVIWFKNIVIR